MSDDRDLDRLYQRPVGEFTAARHALAKGAGRDAARIRTLEKPSVPAWAVNQLYWRERKVYDKLIRASERVRAGHARALKGKAVDLPALEREHGQAVKAAANRVRAILARAGDPATSATMTSVVDTLQALPGGGQPGRLVRPLAPIGFGAFGALLKGAATSKALAEVVTFAPARPKPGEAAEAARRARDAAARRLRDVERRAKRTAAALAAARTKLDRAERRRQAAEAKLDAARAETDRLRSDVAGLERDLRVVDQERARLKAETARPGSGPRVGK